MHFGNKINVKNSMKNKIYPLESYDDEYYNSMSIAHSLYDAINSDSYIKQIKPNPISSFINPKMVISPIFKDCWDRKPKNESQIKSESEYPNAIDIEKDEYFSKMSLKLAFKN
tara:strand:+ start:495 stop:833 length:339 start_codon:yes stop_codon:yes gene_type:complete